MLRFLVAFPSAVGLTLALFWLMQWLIIPETGIKRGTINHNMVDFVRVKRETRAPEEKQRVPDEPKPMEMPKMYESEVATQSDAIEPVAMDIRMPAMQSGTGFVKGAKIAMPAMRRDSELIALVRINPLYPMRARRLGQEGYVKVRVHVGKDGKPKKVEILEAQPPGVFERSVIRALKRWKFKPKTVGGKPVEQSGTLRLDFKLKERS